MSKRPFDINGRLTAWEIIKKEGFSKLPIDPLSIIKNKNIRLLTFDQFSKLSGHSLADIIHEYDPDGFTAFDRHTDQFMICYNNNVHERRQRWTLMHELSHIYLNHINSKQPVLKRSSAEKSHLDILADNLTARLLCPTVILHMCCVSSAEEIEELCQISKQAAQIRWEHLQIVRKHNRFLNIPAEREIIAQFAPWICQYIHIKRKGYFD